MFYVYVIQSFVKPEFVYVGYSADLQARFDAHNRGGVLSTKPYSPYDLIFYEAYKNSKDAKAREQYFKTTKGRRTLHLMLKETLSL